MDYEKVLRDGKMDAFIASRWLKENSEVARKALQAYAEEQGVNSVYELFPGRIPEGGEIDYNPGFFESALNATQNFLGNNLHSDLHPTYNPPRKIAPSAKPSLFDLEKMSGLDFGLEGSETPKDVFTDDEYLQERAKSKVYKPDYRSKDQKEAVKPAVTDPAPAPAPAQTLDNPNPKPSGTAAAAKAARKTSQDAFGEDDQQARIEKSEAIRRTQNEIAAQKKQDSMNASRAHQENVLAEMWEKYSATGRADGRRWSELPENEKREMRKRYVESYSPKQKQEAPADNNIIVPGQGEAGGFLPPEYDSESDMIGAGIADGSLGRAPQQERDDRNKLQRILDGDESLFKFNQGGNSKYYKNGAFDGRAPVEKRLTEERPKNKLQRVLEDGAPIFEFNRERTAAPAPAPAPEPVNPFDLYGEPAAPAPAPEPVNPFDLYGEPAAPAPAPAPAPEPVNPFDLYGEPAPAPAPAPDPAYDPKKDPVYDQLTPVYGTENNRPKIIGYRNKGAMRDTMLKERGMSPGEYTGGGMIGKKAYNPFEPNSGGDLTKTYSSIMDQGGARSAFEKDRMFDRRQDELSKRAKKRGSNPFII